MVEIREHSTPRLTRRQRFARALAGSGALAGVLLLWEVGAWYAQRPAAAHPLREFTVTAQPPATTAPAPIIVERDVDVHGVRIHYAEGGAGPPLVFCHGWTLNHRIWFRNLEPLARDFHVYAIDWPGFGASGKPADGAYDPLYQAGMLAGFLDALGLEKIHLVGHSMGGHWTTAFLLKHPDRVDRYVAVASAAMVPGPPLYRSRLLRFVMDHYYRRLARRPNRAQAQMGFWKRHLRGSEPITPEFLAAVSNYDTRGDGASVPITMAAFTGMLATPLRTQVHRIETPTLVIWGNRDVTVPLRYGRLLARSLPNARLLVLDGVGHMPFLQEPDAFNHAVLQFLTAEVEASAAAPTSPPI